MSKQIPEHLFKSHEWRAALLLLNNTIIKKFFTTEFVNLQKEQIDFKKMLRAAHGSGEICLIKLAAHLFNVWQFPKFPGEDLYNLDYDNKTYAFLAMMIRHGVHPDDVAKLIKKTEV